MQNVVTCQRYSSHQKLRSIAKHETGFDDLVHNFTNFTNFTFQSMQNQRGISKCFFHGVLWAHPNCHF